MVLVSSHRTPTLDDTDPNGLYRLCLCCTDQYELKIYLWLVIKLYLYYVINLV